MNQDRSFESRHLHLVSQPGILSAKLEVPHLPEKLVSRPRLLAELDRGFHARLVLVTAPAGYGKTTLAAEWLSRRRPPAAWISLDEGDNNPARFWRHLAVALEPHCRGLFRSVEESLFLSGPGSAAAVAAGFIDRAKDCGGQIVLVFDDCHLLTDPRLHEGLDFLLRYLPANLCLFLLGRALPPLRLARLKAKGRLQEIDRSKLKFTFAETAQFCRRHALPLEERQLQALESSTEGWAAALQLAALAWPEDGSLRGDPAASLSGQRDIAAYLSEEVLSAQPAAVRDFLMQTSVLDHLFAPLCDAVTAGDNSGLMLEELYRKGLFMVALDQDREGRRYRYHHLFAAFLREQLQLTAPGLVSLLHSRAGAWYAGQGRNLEAIEHFLKGEGYREAVSLIKEAALPMLNLGEMATLLSWWRRLPRLLQREDPCLTVIMARALLLSKRLDEAAACLDDLEQSLAAAGPAPLEEGELRLLRGKIAYVRGAVAMHRRQFDAAGDYIVEAANLIPGPSAFISAGANPGKAYLLGSTLAAFGRLDAVRDLFTRLLDVMRGMADVNRGYAFVIMAEIFYETDALDSVMPALAWGLEEAEKAADPGALVPAYILLCRYKRARGDLLGALEVVEAGEEKLRALEISGGHWFSLLAAQRVRLHLDRGQMDLPRWWLEHTPVGIYDHPEPPREYALFTCARVLLAGGKVEQALILLQRLQAYAGTVDILPARLEALCLLALAYRAAGKMSPALAALREALELGAAEGYIRAFVDEGAPMAELLSALIRRRAGSSPLPGSLPPAYLKKLYRLTAGFASLTGQKPPGSTPERPAIQPLIEPLIGRELEVLSLLEECLSNEDIAWKLALAPNTVKAHLRNIFDKLNVRSRAAAVHRARELDLLPR